MFNPNVKDSRWLTLEVCREFQRTKCSRTENECKFAHPPPHVEVQNGRVTCCFDSIKGKCQRKEPPCKYLHPPQHLREQLLQNGRNNLILKNLQMQYIAAGIQPPMIPSVFPAQGEQTQANSASPEYRTSPNPTYYTYEQVPPYLVSQTAAAAAFGGQYGGLQTVGGAAGAGAAPSAMPTMLSAVDATGAAAGSVATPTTQVLSTTTKITRPDRLEPPMVEVLNMAGTGLTAAQGTSPATAPATAPAPVTVANAVVAAHAAAVAAAKKRARDPASDDYLAMNSMAGGLPGMVPVMKRPALDNKSGMPMYQPNPAAAYQQAALAAMQLQQPPFVPVSTAALRGQPATMYGTYSPYLDTAVAGHPPSMPRF